MNAVAGIMMLAVTMRGSTAVTPAGPEQHRHQHSNQQRNPQSPHPCHLPHLPLDAPGRWLRPGAGERVREQYARDRHPVLTVRLPAGARPESPTATARRRGPFPTWAVVRGGWVQVPVS